MTVSPYAVIGGYWTFSAIVGGMPEPDPSASICYRWAFASLHILAGNVLTAVQVRYKLPALVVPPDTAVQHSETTTVVIGNPQK